MVPAFFIFPPLPKTMRKEAYLRVKREPLQVPYPPNFPESDKSTPDMETLWINTQPRWLTLPEISLVEDYLASVQKIYKQELVLTGAMLIDSDDPLLKATHEELTQVERNAGQRNTRTLQSGGTRSIYERVLIIRERGYQGGISVGVLTAQS